MPVFVDFQFYDMSSYKWMQKFLNQFGVIQTLPLLLIIATLGIIAFLLVTSTAPFNQGLFNTIIPKSSSHAALIGDINGDGKVDIFDFNILVTNFGKTGPNTLGDLDNNGKVDIQDYNLLITHFGEISMPSPTSTPTPIVTGVWKPNLNTPWLWMIAHALDINNSKDMGLIDPNGNPVTDYLGNPVKTPEVYDIDGFFNGRDPNCNIKDKNGVCVQGENDVVKNLHAQSKKVICYIDVGAYETYRPDAYKFPPQVIGSVDKGWNGSFWLDIRKIDILGPIMQARMKMCRDKGYDAIEPDEIDGYSNDTKFGMTYQDQITYNKFIANMAHQLRISIGLKGDIDQVKDLVNDFDWTLNEQCYQYNECNLLDPFINSGKAVFQVEYQTTTSAFCPKANSKNYNAMKMPLNLDGGRWPCR